jgi:hypothetical protein
MVEAGHGSRLVHKAGAQRCVLGVARGQSLDGDLAAQRLIHREEDTPHAARADFRQNLVPGEAIGQRGVGLDHTLDFVQRGEFPGQFRKQRDGGIVAACFAVHVVGKGFGQLAFARFVHQALVSWQRTRKRLSAR